MRISLDELLNSEPEPETRKKPQSQSLLHFLVKFPTAATKVKMPEKFTFGEFKGLLVG